MLYLLSAPDQPLTTFHYAPQAPTVGIFSRDAFIALCQAHHEPSMELHISTLQETPSHNVFIDMDDALYCTMDMLYVQNETVLAEPLSIFIRHNLFIVLTENDASPFLEQCFQSALRHMATKPYHMGHFISTFLRLVTASQQNLVYHLQQRIQTIDEEMIDGARKSIDRKLAKVNRTLLKLYRYNDMLIAFTANLNDNDSGLFIKSDLIYFHLLTQRFEHAINNIHFLRDYVAQVRESYQAQLDIDANHVMKVLTVVTAFFSPLMLLVGWYGMNFQNMPELHWTYGYPAVAMLSVGLIIGSVILFKKLKLF